MASSSEDQTKEPRPYALDTVARRVETGWGKVYVRVGFKDDEPFEVFVEMGNSGGFTKAQCEALGKTLSNALRSGADAVELADDLIGIRAGKVERDNGERIQSIPDAVGVAMKRIVTGEVEVKGE